MRYILDCLSDTHNGIGKCALPQPYLEPGDVWILLHAGDHSFHGYEKETKDFAKWLKKQPHHHKVVISGNHEVMHDHAWVVKEREQAKQQLEDSSIMGLQFLVDRAEKRLKATKAVYPERLFSGVATYLTATSVIIEGLTIYGDPRSLEFFDWGFMISPEESKTYWAKAIPEGTDVVLVHGPPKGTGDKCPDMHDRNKQVFVGDPNLGERLNVVKPAVCVFGHIHEGFGAETPSFYPNTLCVNASFMDGDYKPRDQFIRVILDENRKLVGHSIKQVTRP